MTRESQRTCPLGIDIGESRVRVALTRSRLRGLPELVAVAARPRGADLARTIADAVAELHTRERRCVMGVGEPVASLRAATFPPMRRDELERAARFEAGRQIDYPVEDAIVRVVPLDVAAGESAIGVVRKDVIATIRSAARAAKLRLVAVDNAAFALSRALPDTDAVLDVGLNSSLLYIYGRAVPHSHRLPIGGAAFTSAIEDAFGTDDVTAERRKLAHGIGGSAEDLRDRLVAGVANVLVESRAGGFGDVRSIALVGNGARLDGLATAIERAAAVRVALATFAPGVSDTLPPDVLRAAAPDWCQAYGLSLWSAA